MANDDESWPLTEGGAEASNGLVAIVEIGTTPGARGKLTMAECVGCIYGTHGPVGIRIVLTIPAAMAAGIPRVAYKVLQAIAFPLQSPIPKGFL